MAIKAYKQFNSIFLTLVSFNLLAVGLFNILIDPYGVFNTYMMQGVNQIKPTRLNHARLTKAVDVTHIKPKTILLGSSTALRLSAVHPVFVNTQPAYNLGLPGAGMQEELLYFQHALINQPDLKQLIISLDFFSFGVGVKKAPDFIEDRLQKNRITTQDALNAIFSLSAFKSSWDTLATNRASKTGVSALTGLENQSGVTPDQGNSRVLKNFEVVISSYFQQEERYKNYQISNERLKDFKTIIDICRQRKIAVKVFFSPTHAVQLQALHVAGLSSAYKDWQRQVVKIIPTWDFTGYSQINTESINGEMKNYVDGAHYQYRIADLILNRMFQYHLETVPSDFGVLLTPETIEPHFAAISADQIVWEKNNPKMSKFVQDLYAKANRLLN
jgi:hypothetical protein